MQDKPKHNGLRRGLMLLAFAALAAGLWAGLLRLGWNVPPLSKNLALIHGPLMVAGFLGTLISLERATALSQLQQGRRVYFLAPMLAALGMITLFLPVPAYLPALLLTLAAAAFLAIFIVIYRLQPSVYNGVMGVGVLLWLVGNGLWMGGLPVSQVVPWWAGFLVLTIAGERLELAKMFRLSKTIRAMFLFVIGVTLAGLLAAFVSFDFGLRLAGLGLAGLGLWLLRFDIARRTIRQRGLPRFIAACLLPGYLWLTLGGLLWVIFGARFPAGPFYDAMLHTIFVGFVISMIFGHAPVIIPAVMGVPMQYLPGFYLHLALLHISLVLRITGDLLLWGPVRQWGGLLNEVAVILFVVMTVYAIRQGAKANRKN